MNDALKGFILYKMLGSLFTNV